MSKRRKRKKKSTGAPIVPRARPDAPLTEDEKKGGKLMLLFMALSTALLLVRWLAARVVGFGDSEALYACYALHPQAAYLDHPGLVGVFARALGGDGVPSPPDAHTTTALLATILPWLVVLVARRVLSTSRASAMAAGLVFALVPEIAIGLFAMTPDLLLAYLELGAIGLALAGMDEDPKSPRAGVMLALGGLAAGVGGAAKISGLLVLAGLAVAYARSKHRASRGAWIGIAAGALVSAPTLLASGPMLHHRAAGFGLSWKGVAALTGGQLAYLSPILAIVAASLVVDVARRRNDDDAARVLGWTTLVPLGALALVSLAHRGAEPHWIAPGLLPLPLWAARRADQADLGALSRRWLSLGGALAFAMVAGVHFWTLYPKAPSLAPASYDPKLDITNELYGWQNAFFVLRELGAEDEGTVVVGPHWTICAQIQAALSNASVGCAGDAADFAIWNPREAWERADRVLFVTDARFPSEPEKLLPQFNVGSVQHVSALRGGRVIRTFTITLLERRARA